VALPLAVFALLVMGVLAATSLLLGRQEHAAGANALRLQEALAAGEGGMHLQTALWNAEVLNVLAVGDSVPFSGSFATGGWYRGATRRLNDRLFLVRSEGFSRDAEARQQVGMVVRLAPIEVALTAALRTGSVTAVAGLARLDGANRAPAGRPDCDTTGPAVAGIHTPDAGGVSETGCAGAPCVTGSPAVWADPALDSAALATFADTDFDGLRALAALTVAGGTRLVGPSLIGGVCNVRDADNWGSPLTPGGPCGRYFPVVWSAGDLTVTGGQGQGVLLVDGNLVIGGGFTFHGVVIVRGGVASEGPGGVIVGALVAVGGPESRNDLGGNTLIQYSACAAAQGLLRGAPATPLRSRSWSRLP
jgi:hypothetical protein